MRLCLNTHSIRPFGPYAANKSSPSSSSSFYLPNITTVCTSTSIQFIRAVQLLEQGQTRTQTAAIKRSIRQLLGTYSITQVKYYKQTRKLEKSIFLMLFLKTFKNVKFTVDDSDKY